MSLQFHKILNKWHRKFSNFFAIFLLTLVSNFAFADLLKDAYISLNDKDYKLAVEKFKKLSELGNSEAFLQLGKLYFEHNNSENLLISEEEAISYLKKATDASIPQSFYILGTIYKSNGKPIEEVFNLYLQGAKLGDANAQEAVADSYWHGEGVEVDWKKSFEWNLRGAKNGNSRSLMHVKFAYANGLTGAVEANDEQVVYWIKKSVENGDNKDLYCLASRYELGVGVKKDMKKAIELYSKFKDTEFSYTMDANLAIATIYLDSEIRNKSLATKFFKLSRVDQGAKENEKMIEHYSELSLNVILECEFESNAKERYENLLIEKLATLGDSFSQYRLAYSVEETNPIKALALYREAATNGEKLAMERMGELYEKGKLIQKNEELSRIWYRKYIEIASTTELVNKAQSYFFKNDFDRALFWVDNYKLRENPEAQSILGELYLRNERTKYLAIKPLKFAADKGQNSAQYTLASLYFNGDGVVKSLQNSFDLYKKSAEQGNSFSQLMLSKFYYEGLINSPDKEKAYFWILLSASNDNSKAKKFLSVIEKEIPKHKTIEIQNLAINWKPIKQYIFDPLGDQKK